MRPAGQAAEDEAERAMIAIPVIGRTQPARRSPRCRRATTDLHAARHAAARRTLRSKRGDSMIEAGLFDGDTVVIRKQDTAETGISWWPSSTTRKPR